MIETPQFSRVAVAAPHKLAAEAGRAILKEGGNAIEAMVAMAAVIAVVYPHMNGIGGDGFWTIRTPDGKVRAIEACGQAGEHATIKRYREKGYGAIPVRGPDAALTVAGAIGGWSLALELAAAMGGKIPLDMLLSSARDLAKTGAPVSASEARYIIKERADVMAVSGFATHFLGKDGAAPERGTIRVQSKLGAVFEQLAHAGLQDFYRGDIAHEIAADLEKVGSPVTREDFRRYHAKWRNPLSIRLNGVSLYNNPPPTQGLASLAMHGIFARLEAEKPESFQHIHGLIEAAKQAYFLRDQVVTDYDRLTTEPADSLTDAVLGKHASRIRMDRAASWPLAKDDGDTIWMGAMDASGLAISFIQSIYWEYGSGVVLPRTGILWQNRGMAFSLDEKALNPLEPGRRPFHTLNCPLAVFDDGRILSYGAMGGDGQPQFQAQVYFRALRYGLSLSEALDRPRFLFGKTWGKPSATLKVENRFEPSLLRRLENAGHEVELIDKPYADMFGHAGMLMLKPNGRIEADHDPRADGGAAGI